MTFETDIFAQFDRKWALLTAGTPDDFNMMTISWGGMGTLWSRPAVTVYVRESRYTLPYMQKGETFTVSFYPEEQRKCLAVLGTMSGREMDKMHDSGLTPVEADGCVTFDEAQTTLVCKKLFSQLLPKERIPEQIVEECYSDDAEHVMFIGEVTRIIR